MLGIVGIFSDAVGNLTGSALPVSPDIGSVLQQFAQQFVSVSTVLLNVVNSTVIDVARIAYVSLLLVGLVLYYTRLEKRLGKDLIKGGVLLAILVEFVFPYIVKL